MDEETYKSPGVLGTRAGVMTGRWGRAKVQEERLDFDANRFGVWI